MILSCIFVIFRLKRLLLSCRLIKLRRLLLLRLQWAVTRRSRRHIWPRRTLADQLTRIVTQIFLLVLHLINLFGIYWVFHFGTLRRGMGDLLCVRSASSHWCFEQSFSRKVSVLFEYSMNERVYLICWVKDVWLGCFQKWFFWRANVAQMWLKVIQEGISVWLWNSFHCRKILNFLGT